MTLNSKFCTILLVAASAAIIYWVGYEQGKHSVQEKWDEQKLLDSKAIDKIKGEQDVLNRQHSYEVGLLESRLETVNKNYEDTINTITSQYADRMQQSEKRATIYKRKAEAGTIECSSLASHAARLDSSLEQGRQLVEELRATVRLRDGQIIELSNQIRADRKLLE